ncbi:response regulator transcription factor [Enterobacter hormaechei]|nr:response regulator transcription factor [Enterobacter hormaechei]
METFIMKRLLFISDNIFFCAGVDSNVADTRIVGGESANSTNILLNDDQIPVVRVSNLTLRRQIIEKIQSITDKYIVTLDEIYPRSSFKLGDVLFCGNLLSYRNIIKFFECNRKNHFAKLTDRELAVLYRMHNDNAQIAEEMNLSVKTISHYKLSILEKLRVDMKSNINLLKVKLTLDQAYLYSVNDEFYHFCQLDETEFAF